MLPLLSMNCRATFAASCVQRETFSLHMAAIRDTLTTHLRTLLSG